MHCLHKPWTEATYHCLPPLVCAMLIYLDIFSDPSIRQHHIWRATKELYGLREKVFHIFVLDKIGRNAQGTRLAYCMHFCRCRLELLKPASSKNNPFCASSGPYFSRRLCRCLATCEHARVRVAYGTDASPTACDQDDLPLGRQLWSGWRYRVVRVPSDCSSQLERNGHGQRIWRHCAVIVVVCCQRRRMS